MKNHTFLIKSTKNSSFGTAFCIKQNKNGSYFVTCSHVVEDCGEDNLIIDNYPAKLIAKGSREDIDLAVVFVEGLVCEALKLSKEPIVEHTAFTMNGFQLHYKNGKHKEETLKGVVRKIFKIHDNNKNIENYELTMEKEDSIQQGYSGSAIVCDGFVVAVATDRNTNGKQAYAVPIGYLKEIWEDIPDGLFVSFKFPKLKKFNIINKLQKYLLQTVAGVIILGVLTNFVYDILKSVSDETSKVSTIIKENNSTNSTIELHNEKNSSISKKEIELIKNQTKNSTIKVFQ